MDTFGSVSRVIGSTDMAPSKLKGPAQEAGDPLEPISSEPSSEAGESPRSHYVKAQSLQASKEYENKLLAIAGSTREQEGRDQITLPLGNNDITLRGVDVTTLDYTERPDSEHEELRKSFNSKWRKNFMKDLGNDPDKEETLRKAGLKDVDFRMMRDGKVPTGFQVHHKIPIDDGGENEMSNFVLIKNDPAHKAITNFQIRQVKDLPDGETRTIDWVIPKGFVYPPEAGYVTSTPRV